MAQHKVVDLVIQHGSVQIVHRSHAAPAPNMPNMPIMPIMPNAPNMPNAPVMPMWLMRAPATSRGMMMMGFTSASAGVMLSLVGDRLLTIWFANSLLSAGLCLLLLGLVKRVLTSATPVTGPAAEAVDPSLLAERSRRVRAILSNVTAASQLFTFERLVKESRWTHAAMLSTLLHMKERGEVVEDLNLDTGEWVYSVADETMATGTDSLMLDERTAQASPPERQG